MLRAENMPELGRSVRYGLTTLAIMLTYEGSAAPPESALGTTRRRRAFICTCVNGLRSFHGTECHSIQLFNVVVFEVLTHPIPSP
jgi:hypothetical protein